MQPEFRKLLPKNKKCDHWNIVWNVLKTTSSEITVRVACIECPDTVTKTVPL